MTNRHDLLGTVPLLALRILGSRKPLRAGLTARTPILNQPLRLRSERLPVPVWTEFRIFPVKAWRASELCAPRRPRSWALRQIPPAHPQKKLSTAHQPGGVAVFLSLLSTRAHGSTTVSLSKELLRAFC